MFGFFTNERFIAEVEVSKPAPVGGPDSGSLLKVGPREEGPAPSMDDRMRELADLLGAAQEAPSAGLYGRSGAADAAPAPAAGATRSPLAGLVSAPARATATTSPARATATTSSARSTVTPKASRSSAAPASSATPKPFTPAKHTLMLPPDELEPIRQQ